MIANIFEKLEGELDLIIAIARDNGEEIDSLAGMLTIQSFPIDGERVWRCSVYLWDGSRAYYTSPQEALDGLIEKRGEIVKKYQEVQ